LSGLERCRGLREMDELSMKVVEIGSGEDVFKRTFEKSKVQC
jgi:hypothetical protein